MNPLKRIGLVGLGRMGANMARRLKDYGFDISALHDIQYERAQALAEELDSQAIESIAEVTHRSDVIITVVSDDAAMDEIYQEGPGGLLTQAEGKLFLNCATVTPKIHVTLQQRAQAIGALMLECPMASSIPQARQGTLYLMCGGPQHVYDMARPVLDALSHQHRWVGEAGAAAELKALVNMVMNVNTLALAEGLGLASALGLDLSMVREVFAQTGANSRVLETDGEDMQHREHSTYFSAAHAAKDCGIAVALGRSKGLALVLARATLGQYEEMKSLGLGELDKSGVSELTFIDRHPSPLIR